MKKMKMTMRRKTRLPRREAEVMVTLTATDTDMDTPMDTSTDLPPLPAARVAMLLASPNNQSANNSNCLV